MSKRSPIRRGAIGRSLAVSLAGARAGGALALDATVRKLRGQQNDGESLEREARRFAQRLGELKGSYVKIGQILAMLGEHMLPQPLTDALHELESGTQPLDWSDIEPVVAESLADRIHSLAIDPDAIAAASLAQVHRASTLAGDEELVLKIQFPALVDLIDEDFDAVIRMMRLARWLPAGRDLDAWLENMRNQLHLEVDYVREAAVGKEIADLIAGEPFESDRCAPLQVPNYFPEYSGGAVLAMSFVDGVAVTHASVASLPQSERDRLGRTMLALFLKEVFDWGLMQTDPNLGNYLVDVQQPCLIALDLGSVVRLERRFMDGMQAVILGGYRRDDAQVLLGLELLGCLRENSSDYAKHSFITFIHHVLEPLAPPNLLPDALLNERREYRWGESALVQRVGKKAAGSAASRHFSPPAGDFAVIARKLTGVFTFISVLQAEFNGYELLAPYLSRDDIKRKQR